MQGDLAAGVGGIGADIALLAAPGGAVSKLGSAGKRLLGSAALGAGYGGLGSVAEGESRGVNTAGGAGLGFLGQGAAEGVTKLGRGLANAYGPQAKAIYEAAKARGIPLTPAQLSKSEGLKRRAAMMD